MVTQYVSAHFCFDTLGFSGFTNRRFPFMHTRNSRDVSVPTRTSWIFGRRCKRRTKQFVLKHSSILLSSERSRKASYFLFSLFWMLNVKPSKTKTSYSCAGRTQSLNCPKSLKCSFMSFVFVLNLWEKPFSRLCSTLELSRFGFKRPLESVKVDSYSLCCWGRCYAWHQ